MVQLYEGYKALSATQPGQVRCLNILWVISEWDRICDTGNNGGRRYGGGRLGLGKLRQLQRV